MKKYTILIRSTLSAQSFFSTVKASSVSEAKEIAVENAARQFPGLRYYAVNPKKEWQETI